jgi:transposase InsO family protein
MGIVKIMVKDLETVALKLDRTWFARHLRPLIKCVRDNGAEFTGSEFQQLLDSHGTASVATTVRNLQANSILERAHQVIGGMLRTFELPTKSEAELNDEFVHGVFANAGFARRSTFHTGIGATPGQLFLGEI